MPIRKKVMWHHPQTMMGARASFLWMWIGLLMAPGAAYGQQCIEAVLCVITEERAHAVAFYVDNLLSEDLIVIFDVDAENVTADVGFPHWGTYAGKRKTLAFTLRPRNRRAAWRYSYTFQWRNVVNRLGCEEGLFCIEVEERDAYLEVYVVNQRPFDLTIGLDVEVDQAVAEVPTPYVATYPGTRRKWAFRLKRLNRSASLQYTYSYHWLHGSLHARHDDAVAYGLPYAPGKAFAVIQGFNGTFSHQGKHALDWDMPERTPIHAARGGIVVDVVVGYTEGGLEERLKTKANHILIQHDDGTLGNYVHLAPNGAFVTIGQRVAQGQVLGVSGDTGYASGPHLHFEVFTVTQSMEHRTIPVRFRLEGRQPVELKEGRVYSAPLH